MDSYKTVMNEASDEFTEKRSRFIGYVCPVTTEDECTEFINRITKKHYDAKHNVYAYVLRQGNIKRFSDDGEPQGTAGMPVLDVIQKRELEDVCVVVTRYFGGILLGGGGLVRAYSNACRLALDAGGEAEVKKFTLVKIVCDYAFHDTLTKFIGKTSAETVASDFSENVGITVSVPAEETESFSASVFEMSKGKITPEIIKQEYLKRKI
ncbi:MAG: YigZ family protein [Ruminococcaceae bacterium]|nr:YigZ family protein [Oscillospiraceae bacterium]